MANKNKVQFGLSRLAIARMIPAATPGGTPTFGDIIEWPGAVSLTMDSEDDESTFYADNRKYWGMYVDNGYTGEIETALLPPAVAEEVLGWMIDQLGGLVEVTNGRKNNFALLGQWEGDQHGARWVMYNCTAGKPSSDTGTTEDTTDPQTQSMPYTATSINIGDGIMVSKYILYDDPTVTEAHTAYLGWYDEVKLPVPVAAGGDSLPRANRTNKSTVTEAYNEGNTQR